MIKKVLFLAMLTTALFSNSFDVNSTIGSFELADQFENKQTVNADVKTIIFSAEKTTSAGLNEFLSSKEKGFLEKNNTVFIADISGMPSVISYLFALPKMKKYNYNVLLIQEEDDKRFSTKEEKLTVYKLENGIVKSVQYIDIKDIPAIF
jgi:hypothetical protein